MDGPSKSWLKTGTTDWAIGSDRSESRHMASRIYLDTSAYLAALLDEPGAETIAASLRDAAYLSSVLLAVEVRRTLVRLSREGKLEVDLYLACLRRLEEDLECFTLREVTLDLCDLGAMPSVVLPRSMDLVHLRTALWFHRLEPIESFVSLDTNQIRAARELGLPLGPLGAR